MRVKRSVSLAITDPGQPGALLLVQRPAADEELPGVWGLPAASLGDGESWEDAARRAGRQKLGVELALRGVLQRGSLQRAGYLLDMRLYAADIATGEPHAPQASPGVTQYQAVRWGAPAALQPAAEGGSLCSRLYLRWWAAGGAQGGHPEGRSPARP
jgi:ADP-ribose pyrophosphatase YjhB (NUDIX family)